MQTVANPKQKLAIKRLMSDLAEIQSSPINSISAAPLDNDMFEWHCNIICNNEICHLALFFDENHPFKSPSAEFLPKGQRFIAGAQRNGKKGTQICMNIFNDYDDHHKEWERDWGHGWSPGYTVQTILLNVQTYINEHQANNQIHTPFLNKELNRKFKCSDCGHCLEKPYPEFHDETKNPKPLENGICEVLAKDQTAMDECVKKEKGCIKDIACYISYNTFKLDRPKSNEDIFGFGVETESESLYSDISSPCEFLTADAFFSMQKSGLALSSRRTKLDHFLPLFIHPAHGEAIQDLYTNTMELVTPGITGPLRYIHPLFSLMHNISDNIAQRGHCGASEVVGLCFLHRLALWAAHTFPGVQEEVDKTLHDFINNEDMRKKIDPKRVREMLQLLLISKQFKWRDVSECFINLYLCWQAKYTVPRLPQPPNIAKKEFLLAVTGMNKKSWQTLAFQLLYVEMLSPDTQSREEIIHTYDSNCGFPPVELRQNLQELLKKTQRIETYGDWFKMMSVEVPNEDQFHEKLLSSLKFADKELVGLAHTL